MKYHEIKTHYSKDKIKKLSETPFLYEFSMDTEKLLVKTIIELLMDAGLSPKLKGFNYIVDSIRIMYRKRFGHILITKDIYFKLAVMYNVSPYIIEHNIRNSIHTAWTKYLNGLVRSEMFEVFDERPTNFEFIVYISRLATERITNPQMTLWEIEPEL